MVAAQNHRPFYLLVLRAHREPRWLAGWLAEVKELTWLSSVSSSLIFGRRSSSSQFVFVLARESVSSGERLARDILRGPNVTDDEQDATTKADKSNNNVVR